MRIRSGFVSNSSSSSFLCSVCKEIESGMDASLSDFDMIQCINGHEMHKSCAKIPEEILDLLSDIGYDFEEYLEENKEELGVKYDEYKKLIEEHEKIPYGKRGNLDLGNGIVLNEYNEVALSESACPICNFSAYSNEVVLKFIFKSGLLKEDEVKEQIKSKFKSYTELEKWVKE